MGSKQTAHSSVVLDLIRMVGHERQDVVLLLLLVVVVVGAFILVSLKVQSPR